MPDTMIQTSAAPITPAGIVSEYRSPLIGQLVAARARATKEIKTIIKDKKATIPNKSGGNGYQYAYADLADVMDAVDDALAAQEIAIFQTLQERGGKPVLVTTLAHSSDQWVSSELRVTSIDAGPQVFGSSLTYARRYSVLAILGLAPDADDDGRAAQDRADQARQRSTQRAEQSRSTQDPPKPSEAPQHPPADSAEPVHMPLPIGKDGPLVNRWTKAALEALEGKPLDWRYAWLALHVDEMTEVHELRSDNWGRINAAVIGADTREDVA
jgi:predicted  nucleic acid-binding Zn-ribbon protein